MTTSTTPIVEFPVALPQVQQALLLPGDAGLVLDGGYLHDEANMVAFLDSFAAGFRLPYMMVARLTDWQVIERGVSTHWSGVDPFLDDSTFTQERFMLITSFWDRKVVPVAVSTAAKEQVIRMFHAGRLLPEYIQPFTDLQMFVEDLEFRANIYVHDARTEARTRQLLPYLLKDDPQTLVAAHMKRADELRLELFSSRWLPAFISAAEHEQTKNLPASLLMSLYIGEWAGGYDLYYGRMMGLIDLEDI